MPSSPIQGFTMADSSTHNSFECTTSIPGQYDEADSELKDAGKSRFNQGHALLRKQAQRPIILQAQKAFGRRRFTFSGNQDQKVVYKKRRRFTSVALPTKFLLGGNINDPLNLGSLQDEKINKKLNEFSPASSPMPTSNRRTQVQVLIPPNIYDPLNLNTGEDIEFNLLTSKPRKRRRHRKSRKDDDGVDVSPTEELPQFSLTSDTDNSSIFLLSYEEGIDKEEKSKDIKLDSASDKDDIITQPVDTKDEIEPGKISTPVIQGSPSLPTKKTLPKSISKDENAKIAEQKQVVKQRKTKVRQDTVKFRANAEIFCYGNHIPNQSNWNLGMDADVDIRLRFFNEDLFNGKDVLDIGCNTGQLSLHVASQYHPNKVVGIDIDKKLINKAQRTVRFHLSEEIARKEKFPSSMATLYGPLAKLVKCSVKQPHEFPNNVTFFEANYVPASEDFLETQKPEYDTILCLRVTKWIHLNFGDEGIKMAFKRMFAQLRYGGVLILEPQPWFTYSASKKITPAIYKTYQSLQMRPEMFCDFLLSSEVGFSTCRVLGKTVNFKKGYRQDIFILEKMLQNGQEPNMLMNAHLSPIPYQYDEWNTNEFTEFGIHTGESFSEFERHTNEDYAHFDGDIRENFSRFDMHDHENFMNYEQDINEDFVNFEQHSDDDDFMSFQTDNQEFLNLEHSNECFSDCEEH